MAMENWCFLLLKFFARIDADSRKPLKLLRSQKSVMSWDQKKGVGYTTAQNTQRACPRLNLNLLGWKSKLVYWLKLKLSKNWMMFTNRLRGVLYHSQLKLSLLGNALVLRIITIPYNLSHISVWFCSPHHSVLNCIVNNNSDLSNSCHQKWIKSILFQSVKHVLLIFEVAYYFTDLLFNLFSKFLFSFSCLEIKTFYAF